VNGLSRQPAGTGNPRTFQCGEDVNLATQQPETDLLVPRPAPDEHWDPHTIHTHYFGFHIPEHAIGTFAYIRYMPALGMCHAGFQVYQGIDNVVVTDCLHHDYQIGCPYPGADGARFTANGLTFDFAEPGRTAHITYCSPMAAAASTCAPRR
jgi:hypothetical protein